MNKWEEEVSGMLNRCDWICPACERNPGLADHVRTLLSVIESQRYMLWDHERRGLIACADELIGMMERAIEAHAIEEAEAYTRESAS